MFHHVITENCLEEGIDPEEMQIALAISESLKDQNKYQEGEEASTSTCTKFTNPFTSPLGNVKSISAKLEKFGFKCKKTYTEYELDLLANSKISKRSKFQKFPTVLTRTSNEKRNQIIRLKIDRILEINKSKDSISFSDEPKNDYKVFSCFLQEMQDLSGSVFDINGEVRATDAVLLSYYVTDLFEPSFVKAGHLLKDWNKIPGRDSSPTRCSECEEVEKEHTEDNATENQHTESFEMVKERNSKLIKQPEAVEEKENLSTASSCMDLFADLDDFDDEEIPPEFDKETSGELASHLSTLQDKLSQSIVVDEDGNNSTVEYEENIVDLQETVEDEEDVLVNSLVSSIVKLENMILQKENEIDLTQCETSVTKEMKKIDLTQPEMSIDREFTIPFDDSFHTLKQHMKKILGTSEIPEISKTAATSIQIDLVSSEEDEKTDASQEPRELLDDDLGLEGDDAVDPMCSQNSSVYDDDNVITISDEEINYSMGKYLNNIQKVPQEVFDKDDDDPETVDLTQEIVNDFQLQENILSQFQIENHLGKSLIDVMDRQDEFNINSTIADLLETSVQPSRLSSVRKDRTTKFHESNELSDSLVEIMRKYGVDKKQESSRSFRKMQSESQLESESVKTRKSVQFHLKDDDDVVDLTQPLEDDESMKENSMRFENFDKSIHKSLENILQYSPAVPRKRVLQKRSLGVQIDEDYIVDTESIVAEPEFRNMTPVELKQQLFKYGIRPLPVKKAVELLDFIYDQLHPKIRAAADEEIDVNDSRRELNITDIVTNIGVQDFDEFVFQPGLVEDEEFVLPKTKKSKVSC